MDTLWIESLNTVLDDSKTLCLPNRKRIKLTQTCTFLFEVENLDVASPATVSRCGMVYVDSTQLPWRAFVKVRAPRRARARPPALLTMSPFRFATLCLTRFVLTSVLTLQAFVPTLLLSPRLGR